MPRKLYLGRDSELDLVKNDRTTLATLKSNGTLVAPSGAALALPSYTNANRPAASSVAVGGAIWNTDDNAPNFSDGTNWRDAAGLVT